MDIKKILNPTDEKLVILAVFLIFLLLVINLPEPVVYPQDNYTGDMAVQNDNTKGVNINIKDVISYIKNAGPNLWPSNPIAGWFIFIIISFIFLRMLISTANYASGYIDDLLVNWFKKR